MLSDARIRAAKPASAPYKLHDAGGLYLYVAPSGLRSWRLKYRLDGREQTATLGRYPEIGLAEARRRAATARDRIRQGEPPRPPRPAPAPTRALPTFAEVAREWHAQQLERWSQRHADNVIDSIERDLVPAIGKLPVAELDVPTLLAALREVEARGAVETAHRLRQRAQMVMAYAIATGRATSNPAMVLSGALRPTVKVRRQPAVTTLAAAREVWRLLCSQPAHPETVAAMRFLALTAQRPGDVRMARWAELEGDTWMVPVERMKGSVHRKAMGGAFAVPLSSAAMAVLDFIRPVSGGSPFLFPTPRWPHRPLSENALGYLCQRAGLGGRHVPHGWRATFSTIMNERFPADRAVIDLMLGHAPADPVEAAYNRAQHLDRRRELAEAWGHMLAGELPPV